MGQVLEEPAEHLATVAGGDVGEEAADAVELPVHILSCAGYLLGHSPEGLLQVTDAFHGPVNGVADLLRGLLSDDRVADDTDDALIRCDLLPAHVAEASADGGGLQRSTRTLERLLRMKDGFATGLEDPSGASSRPFGGLSARLE